MQGLLPAVFPKFGSRRAKIGYLHSSFQMGDSSVFMISKIVEILCLFTDGGDTETLSTAEFSADIDGSRRLVQLLNMSLERSSLPIWPPRR